MKMPRPRSFFALLPALGALAHPSFARAHIDLLAPAARVSGRPDTTLAVRPCGHRGDERDEEKVNVFRPGETVDVVWDVYVQHVSYFRIAFDADGDDSFSARPSLPADPATDDPTLLTPGDGETILAYVVDREGDVDHVEERVTLPTVACERCTLQLIQFNYGLPLRDATYHQCADLVLTGAPVIASPAPESGAEGTAPAAPTLESGCALRDTAGARQHKVIGWLVVPLIMVWRRRCARSRRSTRANRGRVPERAGGRDR
jgi:hypothetical protein